MRPPYKKYGSIFSLAAWLWIGNVLPFNQAPLFLKSNLPKADNSDPSRLYLPPDLEYTVWAESPMLFNPTNIDVDIRGRLWVTEAVNYRDFRNPTEDRLSYTAKGDRVLILEDTDGDGKADSTKVFVQDPDLVAPLGIAVMGKQILVSCSPHLILYTDENGDDIPDKKEILLSGFGGHNHDHSLHSVVAGPDGQWYFNTGNAGPHYVTDRAGWQLRSSCVYTDDDKPRAEKRLLSSDGRMWVGGMALRIEPDGTGMKVLGHNFRNCYEVALDSYGNMWQNDNDDQIMACRTSFLQEGGNAGYFSADGTRFYQADRRPGQDLFTAQWHQEDPGVMPAGDNTGAGSPTGVLVYEGDALGTAYRGLLLSCEAGRNVIYSYRPQPKGAGFELNRRNLITTLPEDNVNYQWYETGEDRRQWFRPSDIAAGTDGVLYIADWYDPIVGGHAMHDRKGYGRIYRITKKGDSPVRPNIDLHTVEGPWQALLSPAVNVRYQGLKILQDKGDTVLEEAKRLLYVDNPYHRARGIWLMAHLGDKGRQTVQQLVRRHPDPVFRLTAFRALRSVGEEAWKDLRELLARDPDPAIRRELAIALRDIPLKDCLSLSVELVKNFDGQDPWYRTALGQALEGEKAVAFYPELKKMFPGSSLDWPETMAALVFELHPKNAVEDLKRRAGAAVLKPAQRSQAMTALAFVNDSAAVHAMLELGQSKLPDVASQAAYWLGFRSSNDWADLYPWEATVAADNQSTVLQLREQVLKAETEAVKIKAAELLTAEPGGAQMLLGMAAQGLLSGNIRKAAGDLLMNHLDPQVRSLAGDMFPREGKNWKGKLFSIDLISRMQGDAARGQLAFQTYCLTCHKRNGMGSETGPNLTGIEHKMDRQTLLDAIINPSAALVFGFETYEATTATGQTVFGWLMSDNGSIVVLRDSAGKQYTFRKSQLGVFRKINSSLMPQPGALGLNDQDLADIVQYLQEKAE